ncbi:MAG TPA: LuxR family transcriptional regulator [Acidimicrobiales bacterium]|nr:LuxR family transcriptional regulator [Acidimicrobiales bacterium]
MAARGPRPALFLERDAERRAIAGALRAARRGSGRLLVVEGEAGIGKSRLLDHAARRARAAGMEVLRARGDEHEQALAFGGALQLLEPVVRARGEGAAELFAGPARLAADLFTEGTASLGVTGEARAMAIVRGLYEMVATLCRSGPGSGPVALVVDDAQLLDTLSLRFLAYLAHRLRGLALAVVVAFRADGVAEVSELAALAHEAAAVLRPAPLSTDAVAALLRRGLRAPEVAPEFAAASAAATGGNPFLVTELVAELARAGVRPDADGLAALDAIAPAGVLRAVVRRIDRLGPAAAALARAVAVVGEIDLAMARVLARLPDVAQTAAAADALADVGLLAPGEPLRLRHPLVAAAIAAGVPAGARAALQLAAARARDARGDPAELVAPHLLGALTTGDDRVVAVLEEAAARARARGAPALAARYLERALREPPAPEVRLRLVRLLAEAEAAAGLPGAVEHLDDALASTAERAARVELLSALGRILMGAGRHEEAAAAFQRALAEDIDGPDARRRELRALIACALASGRGEVAGVRAVVADLARVGSGEELPVERVALALVASQEALAGAPRTAFAPLLERALADGGEAVVAGIERDGGLMLTPAAVALLYADDLDRSRALLGRALAQACALGSVPAAATVRYLRSWVLFFTGALEDAAEDAARALDARRLGWGMYAGAACAVLAHARLELGDLAGAEAALAQASHLGLAADAWELSMLLVARGLLGLARGDPAAALADACAAGRRVASEGVSARPIPWRLVAARAALALGRCDEARALAAEERERAEATGVPRTVGLALRLCGLVDDGPDAPEWSAQAVSVLEGSPSRLALAHALVDLGAALRRRKQRRECQEPLRRGLELAERFGARPLAAFARDELRAAGARPRRAAVSGLASLTPSELRVATLAASGLTNREIALRLVVTTKAVEFHLRHVFAKLGVSRRGALATIVGSDPPGPHPAPGDLGPPLR